MVKGVKFIKRSYTGTSVQSMRPTTSKTHLALPADGNENS